MQHKNAIVNRSQDKKQYSIIYNTLKVVVNLITKILVIQKEVAGMYICRLTSIVKTEKSVNINC